jgi:hypothetical protein
VVTGRIDFVAEVMVWRRRVGIGLVLHLIERRLLPLFLLAKDVNIVL